MKVGTKIPFIPTGFDAMRETVNYCQLIDNPRIPYISNSHLKLRKLYADYGTELVDKICKAYWNTDKNDRRSL
jgi:hypothetical protein